VRPKHPLVGMIKRTHLDTIKRTHLG